jgi:molybdopterin molybdotransferase
MSLPHALRYAEARARVLAAVTPLASVRVPLHDAIGRALRERIVAAHALPPFRNTAMDGYAVRAADLASASDANPVTLRVVEVLPAGHASMRVLGAGEAARIMTGAPIPAGADAVVPFEEAERDADPAGRGAGELSEAHCVVRRPSRVAEHVREAGADMAAGAVALEAGRELSAYDIALLASLGVPLVSVGARPRVAVFSTGDELLDVGEALRPGAIRDSNLPMLSLLVEASGCTLTVAERLPDDAARVGARVLAALEQCDVVLTIGGVSAGDFDPVKQALTSLDGVELWRVEMRPGRPQAFGAPRGRLFFGLPGNPASVACVFEATVRPALRALQGFAELDRPRVPVRAATTIPSRAGRTDFVRCTLEWRDGTLWADPVGAQVSGHLMPQARAHALLVVPEADEELREGEAATAIVWRMPGGGG